MTAPDTRAFAALLVAVGEVYGEALSDARLELYFAALRDLELSEIRAALNAHVRTVKFFPKPSEIREAISGSAEDRAELAWTGLLQMVRQCGAWWNPERQGPLPWPNAATQRAALDLYGSWPRLCECLPASGPEFLGMAKQFKAAFCAYARRDEREPTLPPSRDEARARLRNLRHELTTRGLPTP